MLSSIRNTLRAPRRVPKPLRSPSTRLLNTHITKAAHPQSFKLLSDSLRTCLSHRTTRLSMTARNLTHSTPRHTEIPPPVQDPSRLGLYYHFIPPPNALSSLKPVFALSFLDTPPPSAQSATIIGFLPAAAEGGEDEAGLNDFMENRPFIQILHDSIRQTLKEGLDDIQIAGATQLQSGWMNINDARNVPALGRVGDPDDLLGSVLIEGGNILADTYQPMPSYRLCTADGIITLTEGLHATLLAHLRRRAQEEVDAAL